MPEVDLVLGNAEKAAPGALIDTSTRVRVNDIMSIKETAGHLIDGPEGSRPGLCRGPERLRPSLHLLHHPLWPGELALGSGRRGGRADPQAVGGGL
jgi:hypothetical protein